MCYYKTFTSRATTHGKKNEALARRKYELQMKKTHTNLSVKETGLWVSRTHPYIAASPDGLVDCKCCGSGLLEVKCPFKDNNLTFREYAATGNTCLELNGSNINLKKTHAYYMQVQCQLFCAQFTYCDFVLLTCAPADNLFIERIYKDDVCIQEMKMKANIFWRSAILKELKNRDVEQAIVYKYVKELLLDALDKKLAEQCCSSDDDATSSDASIVLPAGSGSASVQMTSDASVVVPTGSGSVSVKPTALNTVVTQTAVNNTVPISNTYLSAVSSNSISQPVIIPTPIKVNEFKQAKSTSTATKQPLSQTSCTSPVRYTRSGRPIVKKRKLSM